MFITCRYCCLLPLHFLSTLDLVLASFPGSPLAPTKNKNVFYFSVRARGEPGNEANLVLLALNRDFPFWILSLERRAWVLASFT